MLTLSAHVGIGRRRALCQLSTIKFPGGELHPRIFSTLPDPIDAYTVRAVLRNSDDIMELLLVSQALKMYFPNTRKRHLELPYVPYGRQDRVCSAGDAFGLKVFAELVNGMGYDSVLVEDPHSDVTPALINNCLIVTMLDIIRGFTILDSCLMFPGAAFIAPDAGASKKVFEVAKHYGSQNFFQAEKRRDPKTGEITGTAVHVKDLTGKTCYIFDDICDGGRTFIELAKVLKAKGAEKVCLYVTHGIFSKGFGVFDGLIDFIFCGNLLSDELAKKPLPINITLK